MLGFITDKKIQLHLKILTRKLSERKNVKNLCHKLHLITGYYHTTHILHEMNERYFTHIWDNATKRMHVKI